MNGWTIPLSGPLSGPLSAPLLAAQEATVYRWNRLQMLTEGWQWLLVLAIVVAVVAYVVMLYRRDSQDLPAGVRWALVLLRVSAFAGILFFFLDLERGVERTLTTDSRVAVLLDVSQSMSIQDPDPQSGGPGPSRSELMCNALANSPMLRKLREQHAITIYRYGESAIPEPLASYPKVRQAKSGETSESQKEQLSKVEESSRTVAYAGVGLGGLALLALVVYLLFGRNSRQGEGGSWALLVAMVAAIAAVTVLAVASLRAPHTNILALLKVIPPSPQKSDKDDTDTPDVNSQGDDASKSGPVEYWDVDRWRTELNPLASETRLGDAIKSIVQQERGGPIAGIAILTDGGSNAGSTLDVAATIAQEARIRVYPIGVGSTFQQRDVRVVDLEAPQRVYPGDKFRLTGFLQAFELDGSSLEVRLSRYPVGGDPKTESILVETPIVEVDGNGKTIPLEFDTDPPEGGKWIYALEVEPPAGMTRKKPSGDQSASGEDVETQYRKVAQVEVVDEQSKVLLIAGGATREYRFLRNALHRDKDVSLDVMLQTAEPGTYQEGENLLTEFPEDTESFFAYDCIVAFDPDWLAFTEAHIRLLERWVAEKAGGLVVVCGPVFTPEWSRMKRGADARIDLLKGLYPVQFIGEGSAALTLGKVGGDQAWPLQFSREGQSSKFLWLQDDPGESERLWDEFEGVFGYFAVRDSKQGATVYARFSDPNETSLDDELPIYLAGQFYGAGRVFFQASGEMWRLRALDPEYFAQYYIKLVRWVSQGRLLRDSSRGVLLVDRERGFVGDLITVSSVLTDAQFRPLTAEIVEAQLIHPDNSRTTLTLRALKDSTREGEYQTQFTATTNGDYRIELSPPESRLEELLTADLNISSSKAETQDPLLNEAGLEMLANRTDGQYFGGLAVATSGDVKQNLVAAIAPNDQETVLAGSPDRQFKELLMGWLMALLVGVLGMEWLIRRLSKLA